jgi:hypothetical protein
LQSPDGPGPTETDRAYFRSSDIEFWHIEAVSDISDLVSTKYVDTADYAANHSLEYGLGDDEEAIVFRPDEDTTQEMSRPDLNPDWESSVGAFIAAEKTSINAARLDIGAGWMTFIIDGEARDVLTETGDCANGIDGNSIFFVDESFLSEPVLVTRVVEESILDGTATAASLGISESDFEVVRTLHTSSNLADHTTPIDVNGALILPVGPFDLTDFEPSQDSLDIVVSWDMDGAIREVDGEYIMEDRVGGTAYDFEVVFQ